MKLYETITAMNWMKGAMHSFDGARHCLLGHLEWKYRYTRHAYLADELRRAIATLYPERYLRSPGGSDVFDQCMRLLALVSAFNDHPDTTIDDILRVCKLADV